MGDLIDISVQVERPYPLSPLELNDHVAFELVEWSEALPGEWERSTVKGAYQDGRVLVNATRGVSQIVGAVRVLGATWSQQQANLAALFAALGQFTFDITQELDGVTRTYACEPADITIAGTLDPFAVARSRQVYALSIPCEEVSGS